MSWSKTGVSETGESNIFLVNMKQKYLKKTLLNFSEIDGER